MDDEANFFPNTAGIWIVK